MHGDWMCPDCDTWNTLPETTCHECGGIRGVLRVTQEASSSPVAVMGIHDLVKLFGATYARTFDAIRATGLFGRVVGDTRVWTWAEAETIRAALRRIER
jgi:hypothetical protein